MRSYIINSDDITWKVLMHYATVYHRIYPRFKLADTRFYDSLAEWLIKNYRVSNDALRDGHFEFNSLEDMVEFKLKWL